MRLTPTPFPAALDKIIFAISKLEVLSIKGPEMKSPYLAAALLLSVVSGVAAQGKPVMADLKATPSMGVSRAFAQEQLAWNAVQNGDVAAFNNLVRPPFTYVDATGITAWDAATSARLKDCTTSDFSASGVRTQQPAAGVVILSYEATLNQVCKGVKSPSPIYVMSVWQREASSWKLVAHSESHSHGDR